MGHSMSRTRLVGLALVLAVFAAGCSGSLPNRDEVLQQQQRDSGEAPEPSDTSGVPVPGETEGTPVAAGAPAPTPGAGAPAGNPSATSSPVGATGSGTSNAGGTGGTAQPIRDANLYSGADNTRGITPDQIVMCAHAALIFAQAFDIRPEDLNVYWTDLNARGGIFGRKVTMTFEDDAYSPSQAVTAAENCKAKNPFLLMGGIGFDQIPAVRA